MERVAEEVRALEGTALAEYRREHKYSPTVGEGSPEAKIMLVGEAPGLNEAKSGRPFVGAAGKLLNELLLSIGLQREDIYITNIVKDRPPENRDPRPDEIRLYAPFLERQIEILQPSVIVPLGRFAMDFILRQFNLPEAGQKIGALHGRLLRARAPYGEISILPLYHPATAFYNEKIRATLEQDIQVLAPFVEQKQ